MIWPFGVRSVVLVGLLCGAVCLYGCWHDEASGGPDGHSQPPVPGAGPPDGATDVPVTTELSWPPSDTGVAVSYDLYLGTDPDAVAAADRSSPEFAGNHTSSTFAPADPLEYSTTYYWRVDVVTADGVTVGEVHSFTTEAEGPARPNLVFIMADDMGWGDASCFGATHVETPNIDALAAGGVRFTQFYSGSAVCTPTRASCLTGRYPLRFNITGHFVAQGTNEDKHLPAGTVTLPGLLRDAGYATGHVGKWHLGGIRPFHTENRAQSLPGPHEHGFEDYLALYTVKEVKQFVRNEVQLGESLDRHPTDLKGDEAEALIEKYHAEGRPFFLNLWFHVPHTPYRPATDPHVSKYEGVATGDDLLYRSMVSHLDEIVGRVVGKLKALGIYDDTLIVFTSENGPSYQGTPGPWRGGKADLHEGGIRAPTVAAWPGHIAPGWVSDELCHTNDILPTFCAAAGVALPTDVTFDGVNILPHLTEGTPVAGRGTVFWQLRLYTWYPQPGDKPEPHTTEVARRGRWKLMAKDGVPLILYDLEADPYETTNLLGQEPQAERELEVELDAWLAEPRVNCWW
jgi:N-acetylgalactosamine-6-sulfatase